MALNYRDFGNEEFNAFVEDSNNYGRLTVFNNNSGLSGSNLGVMKISIDDRFAMLLGKEVYLSSGKEHSIDEFASGLFGSRDGASTLGLLDTLTGTMTTSTELTKGLTGEYHLEHTPISQDIKRDLDEFIERYINDPDNRNELVDAARNAKYFSGPYERSVNEEVEKLFVQGKSLDEVKHFHLDVDIDAPQSFKAYMDYIRDPYTYINKTAHEYIDEHKEWYGNQILTNEAITEAYVERLGNASPNLNASRNIMASLNKAFGEELPGKLRLTVARDGKEIEFQYPAVQLSNSLKYRPEDSLWEDRITPVVTRDELTSTFGSIYHGNRKHFTSPNITSSDIVDISYRGKSIYAVPDEVYANKMATREVEAQIFTPTAEAREAIFEPGANRFSTPNLNVDAALETSPNDFVACDEPQIVTVGANANIESMCSDILRQVGNNGIGNVVAVDGKVYMADRYAGYQEMPFKANDLPGRAAQVREQEEPARAMSLSARAAGAKEVSEGMAQDTPERNFDRDAR